MQKRVSGRGLVRWSSTVPVKGIFTAIPAAITHVTFTVSFHCFLIIQHVAVFHAKQQALLAALSCSCLLVLWLSVWLLRCLITVFDFVPMQNYKYQVQQLWH